MNPKVSLTHAVSQPKMLDRGKVLLLIEIHLEARERKRTCDDEKVGNISALIIIIKLVENAVIIRNEK